MAQTANVAAHLQCVASAAPDDQKWLGVADPAAADRHLHAVIPAEVVLSLADPVDHRADSPIADRECAAARDQVAAANIVMEAWPAIAAAKLTSMAVISPDIVADTTEDMSLHTADGGMLDVGMADGATVDGEDSLIADAGTQQCTARADLAAVLRSEITARIVRTAATSRAADADMGTAHSSLDTSDLHVPKRLAGVRAANVVAGLPAKRLGLIASNDRSKH